MNWVYILRCRDGTLYTGWTVDMTNRLRRHQEGKGSRYTRSRLPVELVYQEEHATRRSAMRREWEIKCMKREAKLRLISAPTISRCPPASPPE